VDNKIQALALVIDDNLADIQLFKTAWTNAGHDQSIAIYSCNSCEEAMVWLHEDIPDSCVITGVLVELMLFDSANRSAVDVLSALPLLWEVPVISWSALDLSRKQTDRIRKLASRVWTKPRDLMAWSAFAQRFFNVLDRRSAASSSRFPAI
jgi:hypothetical protein